MYECTIYGSGSVDKIASRQPVYAQHVAAGVGRTLRVHLSDGSTFLLEITSWPPS